LLICSIHNVYYSANARREEYENLDIGPEFEEELIRQQRKDPGRPNTNNLEMGHMASSIPIRGKMPPGFEHGMKGPGMPGAHQMGMDGLHGEGRDQQANQSQQQQGDMSSIAGRFKLPHEVEKLLEIGAFLLFTLYLVNYLYGKVQNINILETWNEQTKDFFTENYAHIGFSKSTQAEMPFM
jgi:hypothetical protein